MRAFLLGYLHDWSVVLEQALNLTTLDELNVERIAIDFDDASLSKRLVIYGVAHGERRPRSRLPLDA